MNMEALLQKTVCTIARSYRFLNNYINLVTKRSTSNTRHILDKDEINSFYVNNNYMFSFEEYNPFCKKDIELFCHK